MSALEEGEKKTELALIVIFSTAKRIIENKKVEDDQIKATGRAIGWIAVVTAGTEYDVFKTLNSAIGEAVEYSKSNKPSTIITSDTRVPITAGKHKKGKKFGGNEEEAKKKKQKAAVVSVFLLGALAIIFGISQYSSVTNAQNFNETIRTQAQEEINDVCKDIVEFTELPPAPATWWDIWGTQARKIMEWQYRQNQAQRKQERCRDTKLRLEKQVDISDKALATTYANIPTNVNSLLTVVSFIGTGTGIESLPFVTQVGTALGQFTKSMTTGTLPDAAGMGSFVKTIGSSFDTPSSTLPAPPAPPAATGRRGQQAPPPVEIPPAPPAATTATAPAAPGGIFAGLNTFTLPSGGRRRTKKGGKKKMRKTHRKPLFKY